MLGEKTGKSEKARGPAYGRVIDALKKQGRAGLTVADISAKTGLALETVRELAPLASDEFSGRLEVTESGEILYSFPQGFTSRYRGLKVTLQKSFDAAKKFLKAAGMVFFKAWIMVMLVGYFVLFMALALASLVISVGVSAKSNNDNRSSRGGGSMYLASSLFNMIFRLWFYSELSKSVNPRYGQRAAAGPPKKLLHHAIFSFVFGDGDPNRDWPVRERQSVIAYIQAHNGVISLPEFIALTGKEPGDAEKDMTAYCVEFGGSPEATEEGTVVYRFDQLLLRRDRRDRSFAGLSAAGLSAPLKRLRRFSSNTKSMNGWFAVINGVNLGFGSYYLFNALATGPIADQVYDASAYLYLATTTLFANLFYRLGSPGDLYTNIWLFIVIGLGVVPLVFSLLFWLIPGLRYFFFKKENEEIKTENLRKNVYGGIFEKPLGVLEDSIKPEAEECLPGNLGKSRDTLIKELGSYSAPEVTLDDRGRPLYMFRELEREKEALEKYRAAIDPAASELGKTIFDSGAGVQ